MSAPDTSLPQPPPLAQPQAPQQPNTAGMTQMGAQDPRSQQGGTFKATGVVALAAMAINAVKQRKQRELDRDMTHFVGLSAGKDEATAQAQKADEIIRATLPKIKANPDDEDAKRQLIQAGEMRKKAQLALQQNEQNLRDLANSPRGAKLLKALEKAAGLDDKHMNSPERQALNKAIQQKQNTDQKTAQLMSLLTQRQQLSPEARAQQQMVQGGVVGKPMTSYQAGELENRQRQLDQARQHALEMLDKIDPQLRLAGKTFDRDENGQIKFGPKGQPIVRMMTKEEVQQAQSMKPSASKPMKPTISNGMLVGITNPADGKLYTNPKDAPEDVQKAWKDISHQLDVAFNRQIFKMQTSFSNAILRGDYMMAKREVDKTLATYDDSLDRKAVMDKNLPEVLNGNQQAMVSMVANHIGMTLGLQRGARITQTVWNEAVATAPWMQRIAAHFDANGYLSGVVLTPEQAQQMVDLAHDRVDVMKDHVDRVKEQYESELSVRPEKKSKSAAAPAKQAPIYGINRKTNTRIESTDGGKTWHKAP